MIIGEFLYKNFLTVDREVQSNPYNFPPEEQYHPYYDQMRANADWLLDQTREQVYIHSFDGTELAGLYYEVKEGAPVAILFHGYGANPYRDLTCAARYYNSRGINYLIPDQRGMGLSEGECITMGVKERYDCKAWCEYVVDRFGDDVVIHLMGLSMGAATVLMAAGLDLPDNVADIWADCGFASAKDIFIDVAGYNKIPAPVANVLVGYICKKYGKFDWEEGDTREALRHWNKPVLLIHGDDDRFVNCVYTLQNYIALDHLPDDKRTKLLIHGAGHGLAHYVDPETYDKTVDKFYGINLL